MYKYFNISLILLSSFIYAAETEHPTEMGNRPKSFAAYLEERVELHNYLLRHMIRSCDNVSEKRALFDESPTKANEAEIYNSFYKCFGYVASNYAAKIDNKIINQEKLAYIQKSLNSLEEGAQEQKELLKSYYKK